MNVLYQPLPTEYDGYIVNTDFQIWVQLVLMFQDDELSDSEKFYIMVELMFGTGVTDIDGNEIIRDHPDDPEEFSRILQFFLSGWCLDNKQESKDSQEVMDFNIDQWRIYSDFRQIYHINLNEASLHWWEFMAMLWNMPTDISSFHSVVSIRSKEITSDMGSKEREMVKKAKKIYSLGNKKEVYTDEQKTKIDAYDKMMESIRLKKKIADDFRR